MESRFLHIKISIQAFLVISTILASAQLFSQNTISEETWNRLVSELPDYSEEADRIRQSQLADGAGKDRIKPQDSSPSVARQITVPKILIQILRIVFIGLGVMALFFLLYQFYKNPSPKDIATEPTPLKLEEEEKLDAASQDELEISMQKALTEKDYQQAIRYQYLLLLKILLDKNHIRWKREKTNQEYAWEIMSRPYYPAFKNALSIFQEVWFGNQNSGLKDYQLIRSEYEQVSRYL